MIEKHTFMSPFHVHRTYHKYWENCFILFVPCVHPPVPSSMPYKPRIMDTNTQTVVNFLRAGAI